MKKKKEMAPALAKYFQLSTRKICLKEQSRIRLATKYLTHMYILI
jgi:hypothetical protein